MMFKSLIALFCVCFACFSSLQASNCHSCPRQGPPGSIISGYAYFSSTAPQAAIGTQAIVNLTILNALTNGFALSGGGAFIPSSGTYQIFFRVFPSAATTVGLFQNANIMPTTVFANTTANIPISGTVIVSLTAGDVITIRNFETAGTFDTVQPGGVISPSLPVEMVILKISN